MSTLLPEANKSKTNVAADLTFFGTGKRFMPKQKDPSKRPCDWCRIKKKKCDGLIPCTSCAKARKGPLTCTYSSRESPIAKETLHADLLKQLEYYKSIVKEIAPEKMLEGEEQLSLSLFAASENSGGKVTMDLEDFLTSDNIKPNVFQYAIPPTTIPLQNQVGNCGASQLGFGINTGPPIAQFRTASALESNTINNDNIEEHLFSLGFFVNMGFSCRSDFAAVLPCLKTASRNLQRAVCYDTIFYSTHPKLFFTNNPTFAERIERARIYEPNIQELLNPSSDPFVLCDDIRALLVYIQTTLKLGNAALAKDLLQSAFELCKRNFQNDRNELLRKRMRAMEIKEILDSTGTTFDSEQIHLATEQNSVIQFLYTTDLLIRFILPNQELIVDDIEIAGEDTNKAISFRSSTNIKWKRSYVPNLGKYTVFEGKRNGYYFDEMKEMNHIFKKMLPDAPMLILDQARTIQFIRELFKINQPQEHKTTEYRRSTHQWMLFHNNQKLSLFVTFHDWSMFARPENNDLPALAHLIPLFILYHVSMMAISLIQIHKDYAVSNDQTLFPLLHEGKDEFTARDIIFACVRVISHVCKEFKKMGPKNSILMKHEYSQEDLNSVVENPLGVNPLFIQYPFVLRSYLVAMEALRIFSLPDADPRHTNIVVSMVESEIIPICQNLSKVWPIGYELVGNLYTMILQVPSNLKMEI